jgi:predicted dehydrogenase
VRSIRASVRTAYHPDVRCDDAVMAFLELRNGLPCTFATASYKDTPDAGVEAHATEILCTDGMVKVDQRHHVYVSRNGAYEKVPVEGKGAMQAEWDAFAASIAGGGPAPVPLEHARAVVAAMEACETSSQNGQTVTLA